MIQGLLLFFQECGAIRATIEEIYQEWGRVKGTPIQVTDQSGEKKVLKKTNIQRESAVYVLIPVRLHVFQIFHVELCRETK